MAVTKYKFTPADALISSRNLPSGGAWASTSRQSALARLRTMGLPGRRDEYWKYTNPATLVQPQAPAAATFEADDADEFGDIDRLKLVFVDGQFDAAASDDLAMFGIEIERLVTAASLDIHWVRDFYGVLETRGHTPVDRPLAALNTAFADDGVVIRVTGKPTRPVSLIYLRDSEDSDAMLHHVIRVEAGAEITVLENGPAAARFNCVMEIDIADDASFHLVRMQGRDHERRAATHIFARLGNKSTFKGFTLTANGVLIRNEAVIELSGDDSVAHIAGAAVGDGDFHHDDTIFVTHQGVGCESRQVFKKVLRNGATGVFQGKILVKPGAQKTDGYQISQALLLDGDSQFLAKPELEIYADDVICSHGSTSGAIDEEALYYMRSRGITRAQAEDFLVLAFLAQAIDEIENEAIAADILQRLEAWLSRRQS